MQGKARFVHAHHEPAVDASDPFGGVYQPVVRVLRAVAGQPAAVQLAAVALAVRADSWGRVAPFTVDELAHWSGLSPATVKRALPVLTDVDRDGNRTSVVVFGSDAWDMPGNLSGSRRGRGARWVGFVPAVAGVRVWTDNFRPDRSDWSEFPVVCRAEVEDRVSGWPTVLGRVWGWRRPVDALLRADVPVSARLAGLWLLASSGGDGHVQVGKDRLARLSGVGDAGRAFAVLEAAGVLTLVSRGGQFDDPVVGAVRVPNVYQIECTTAKP